MLVLWPLAGIFTAPAPDADDNWILRRRHMRGRIYKASLLSIYGETFEACFIELIIGRGLSAVSNIAGRCNLCYCSVQICYVSELLHGYLWEELLFSRDWDFNER